MVLTIAEAEALSKRMYRAKQKQREIMALFEDAMESVKAELYDLTKQQEKAEKPYLEEIAYCQQELENFHMAHFAQTGEKTVRLPHATLTCRKQPQGFTRDDDALLAWAETNAAELVKISRSVAWNDLKKQLEVADGKAVYKPTGEIIEAVTPDEERITFNVEVVE